MPGILIIAAFWAVIFSVAGAVVAHRRARSVVLWAMFGVVLGPLAIYILTQSPPGRCPHCGTRVVGWPAVCTWCYGDMWSLVDADVSGPEPLRHARPMPGRVYRQPAPIVTSPQSAGQAEARTSSEPGLSGREEPRPSPGVAVSGQPHPGYQFRAPVQLSRTVRTDIRARPNATAAPTGQPRVPDQVTPAAAEPVAAPETATTARRRADTAPGASEPAKTTPARSSRRPAGSDEGTARQLRTASPKKPAKTQTAASRTRAAAGEKAPSRRRTKSATQPAPPAEDLDTVAASAAPAPVAPATVGPPLASPPQPPVVSSATQASWPGNVPVSASGVYVGGRSGLVVGARYAITFHNGTFEVLGPLDSAPNKVAFQAEGENLDVTATSGRLVLTTNRRRSTVALAFQSLAGARPEDFEGMLQSAQRPPTN
jgi:hypothetical protein